MGNGPFEDVLGIFQCHVSLPKGTRQSSLWPGPNCFKSWRFFSFQRILSTPSPKKKNRQITEILVNGSSLFHRVTYVLMLLEVCHEMVL